MIPPYWGVHLLIMKIHWRWDALTESLVNRLTNQTLGGNVPYHQLTIHSPNSGTIVDTWGPGERNCDTAAQEAAAWRRAAEREAGAHEKQAALTEKTLRNIEAAGLQQLNQLQDALREVAKQVAEAAAAQQAATVRALQAEQELQALKAAYATTGIAPPAAALTQVQSIGGTEKDCPRWGLLVPFKWWPRVDPWTMEPWLWQQSLLLLITQCQRVQILQPSASTGLHHCHPWGRHHLQPRCRAYC